MVVHFVYHAIQDPLQKGKCHALLSSPCWSIPASERPYKENGDADLIFKIINYNIKILLVKRFYLPARKVTTIIRRGGKECKWNRKELIVDKASVDWEQRHQQNNITTPKSHLRDVIKLLFFTPRFHVSGLIEKMQIPKI